MTRIAIMFPGLYLLLISEPAYGDNHGQITKSVKRNPSNWMTMTFSLVLRQVLIIAWLINDLLDMWSHYLLAGWAGSIAPVATAQSSTMVGWWHWHSTV